MGSWTKSTQTGLALEHRQQRHGLATGCPRRGGRVRLVGGRQEGREPVGKLAIGNAAEQGPEAQEETAHRLPLRKLVKG